MITRDARGASTFDVFCLCLSTMCGASIRIVVDRADALAGKPLGVAGLDLGDNHGPLGVAGDGAGQALEGTGRREGLLAAQVLDDALFGAAVLAHGLNQVEVGVAVDALLADEHSRLAAGPAGVRQGKSARLVQNLASQLLACEMLA